MNEESEKSKTGILKTQINLKVHGQRNKTTEKQLLLQIHKFIKVTVYVMGRLEYIVKHGSRALC